MRRRSERVETKLEMRCPRCKTWIELKRYVDKPGRLIGHCPCTPSGPVIDLNELVHGDLVRGKPGPPDEEEAANGSTKR